METIALIKLVNLLLIYLLGFAAFLCHCIFVVCFFLHFSHIIDQTIKPLIEGKNTDKLNKKIIVSYSPNFNISICKHWINVLTLQEVTLSYLYFHSGFIHSLPESLTCFQAECVVAFFVVQSLFQLQLPWALATDAQTRLLRSCSFMNAYTEIITLSRLK